MSSDLRALLKDPALELEPGPELSERVRVRGSWVRRTNRRGAAGLLALVAGLLVLGPGLPDRFVPEDRRSPAAQAAVLPAVDAEVAVLLEVRHTSYDRVVTEQAVATCTPTAQLDLTGDLPVHRITVTGSAERLSAVRACLQRIPGASVTAP